MTKDEARKPQPEPAMHSPAHNTPKKPKRYGLIGSPLGHSLSPLIHRRIMDAAGINGTYELFEIPPARLHAELPALMRGLDGINCTIPHKTAVLPHLARLHSSAAACRAVNTIHAAIGHNTDAPAFLSANLPLRDARVLLLGSGGTARMMAHQSLLARAASLTLLSRNLPAARALRAELLQTFPVADITLLPQNATPPPCDILLNATPLGMSPHAHELPCDPSLLRPGLHVFDAVYNPTPTRLLLNARKHGALARGGLRMLIRQAIESQRIWNPTLSLDPAALEAALLPELLAALLHASPVKLLLTGFMATGKTTLAPLLAHALNLPFIDLDHAIAADTRLTIPQLFTRHGEPHFRQLEHRLLRHHLNHRSSAVIAAGGGLIHHPPNRPLIRSTNTLVLGLHAPFELLWQRIVRDTPRPLATDPAATRALHAHRLPLLHTFCDALFDAALPPHRLTHQILTTLTQP